MSNIKKITIPNHKYKKLKYINFKGAEYIDFGSLGIVQQNINFNIEFAPAFNNNTLTVVPGYIAGVRNLDRSNSTLEYTRIEALYGSSYGSYIRIIGPSNTTSTSQTMGTSQLNNIQQYATNGFDGYSASIIADINYKTGEMYLGDWVNDISSGLTTGDNPPYGMATNASNKIGITIGAYKQLSIGSTSYSEYFYGKVYKFRLNSYDSNNHHIDLIFYPVQRLSDGVCGLYCNKAFNSETSTYSDVDYFFPMSGTKTTDDAAGTPTGDYYNDESNPLIFEKPAAYYKHQITAARYNNDATLEATFSIIDTNSSDLTSAQILSVLANYDATTPYPIDNAWCYQNSVTDYRPIQGVYKYESGDNIRVSIVTGRGSDNKPTVTPLNATSGIVRQVTTKING